MVHTSYDMESCSSGQPYVLVHSYDMESFCQTYVLVHSYDMESCRCCSVLLCGVVMRRELVSVGSFGCLFVCFDCLSERLRESLFGRMSVGLNGRCSTGRRLVRHV